MKQRIFTLLLLFCISIMLPLEAFAAEASSVSGEYDYVCLDTLVDGSDIRVEHTGDAILLSEDGLELTLTTASVFVCRDGYRIAAMKEVPQIMGGQVYVSADFYEDFLCRDASEQPSLFNGTLFFPGEVLDALQNPNSSAFHQKLLAAVSLPVSMDISAPHIDMGKVFVKTKLSEYPAALANELKKLGYADADTFAYSEYEIISGARSLTEAGMASVLDSYAAIGDVNPDEMTVAEFRDWQSRYTQQQAQAELSEDEKTFMAEKKIEPGDLTHLHRVFYGAYMEQSDTALRSALEAYYATDMGYLQSMRNPFADVSTEDWYYDAALYAYETGLMTGTGTTETIFSPDETASRAMIVTILWRLEGCPVVNYAMSYGDVGDTWYTEAVRWASSEKIVEGYNGKFHPDDFITREQLASILWRYAGNEGIDISVGEDTNIHSYADALDISEFAFVPLQWACDAGIMQGSGGYLMPQDSAARCEVATMLTRFCETVLNNN